MKILLVSPVRDTDERTNKGLMMPQLALYIIEGLTPTKHEVVIIEEEYLKLDLDSDCDLVGISCMTSNANRAYFLAKEFRKRNKTVVLGGVHPTILPREALKYSDSVVVGEAEGSWPKLLEDFENSKLQKVYHCETPDLNKYVPKNFASLKSNRLFNILPLMTTRGCPYNCDFCCVTNLFGKKIRHVPIKNIVRDIKDSKAKNFIFLDDNIIGHPKYSKELFKAIKPLKVKWVGQASISFANDAELMQMAYDSGCRILFIGLESVCESKLRTLKKAKNNLAEMEEAIRKIRKLGILVHASMIFGFDDDTKETFFETVKFLNRNKISTVSFNVLTPYPGTKVYENFKKEGRLLTNNWRFFDHNTVVFKPKNMTPFELQLGKHLARKKFYKIMNVLMRFRGNLFNPLAYLFTNIGHMKQVKNEARRLSYLKKKFSSFKAFSE